MSEVDDFATQFPGRETTIKELEFGISNIYGLKSEPTRLAIIMKANKTKASNRIVHLNLHSRLRTLKEGVANTHPTRGNNDLTKKGKIVPPIEAPAAATPNAKFLRR